MADKVIITCAVTGSAPTADKNPAVPVTPEQIARSSLEAWNAGAAITHIHVRDPKTGRASMEPKYFADVVGRMRATNTDVVINLTTGHGATFVPGDDDPADGREKSRFVKPEERVQHVEELKPEICSLDIATMNRNDQVFINTRPHLIEMAKRIKAAGSKPEIEVFDMGGIELAKNLIEIGLIEEPAMFQLCLGTAWGAPSRIETLIHMRDMLPKGSKFAGFGISRHQMPIAAAICQLGGHVRVGLEDNLYLEHGVLAPSNAALVEKAATLIRMLGFDVASPSEARAMLGLTKAA